jgi:hypothetical protein
MWAGVQSATDLIVSHQPNRTKNLSSEILFKDDRQHIPGIHLCAVVLNKQQMVSKRTEFCREHPVIPQQDCLQFISGNAIERLRDVKKHFDMVGWRIVRAYTV